MESLAEPPIPFFREFPYVEIILSIIPFYLLVLSQIFDEKRVNLLN